MHIELLLSHARTPCFQVAQVFRRATRNLQEHHGFLSIKGQLTPAVVVEGHVVVVNSQGVALGLCRPHAMPGIISSMVSHAPGGRGQSHLSKEARCRALNSGW